MEKTAGQCVGDELLKKHLHGRGEDNVGRQALHVVRGNTSTDVEKTFERNGVRLDCWKHLHGRGEDPSP